MNTSIMNGNLYVKCKTIEILLVINVTPTHICNVHYYDKSSSMTNTTCKHCMTTIQQAMEEMTDDVIEINK